MKTVMLAVMAVVIVAMIGTVLHRTVMQVQAQVAQLIVAGR